MYRNYFVTEEGEQGFHDFPASTKNNAKANFEEAFPDRKVTMTVLV
jgi:hypothetical protein